MGAFTEKVKDGFTKLPPALTLLKIVSLICGALLIIMGFWLFFASFITFSFSGVIVGFYLILGGLMVVLAELQFKWYLKRLNFFAYHIGRGIFYVFVGSLTFAVFGLDGVIAAFLMIIGGIVMVVGVIQIVFQFIAHKFGGTQQGYQPDYGNYYAEQELQDPNFDPNIYSQDIPTKLATPTYSTPVAGSPPQGFQVPSYNTNL